MLTSWAATRSATSNIADGTLWRRDDLALAGSACRVGVGLNGSYNVTGCDAAYQASVFLQTAVVSAGE
ncbi:hypothetical protein PCAR4_350159 [Paraburkholderia caribensis]|nr:hypothetical protein PCAR4_350159 [Paraburkholderia caribensis]